MRMLAHYHKRFEGSLYRSPVLLILFATKYEGAISMPGYELAYVAVAVRDLDAAAKLFSESVGLQRATLPSDSVVFGVGRSAWARRVIA